MTVRTGTGAPAKRQNTMAATTPIAPSSSHMRRLPGPRVYFAAPAPGLRRRLSRASLSRGM